LLRARDDELLRRPYSESELALDHSDRLARRLSVDLPNASLLASHLLADLDETTGGFGWWPPGAPPTRERSLIADQAFIAADALSGLLLEGRLHLSAIEAIVEGQADRWTRSSIAAQRVSPPPSGCGLDDLHVAAEPLHLTGFFRCIAQVFDCLAAVTIAVADLPTNLPRAGWPSDQPKRVKQWMDTPPGKDAKALLEGVHRKVRQAGPPGWLDWTLDMRNLLVHRPRIVGISQVDGQGRGVALSRPRARITRHLPRRPGASWIEALAYGGPTESYLSEDGDAAMWRVLRSTRSVAEHGSTLLIDHLERRRSSRAPQTNWSQQWPESPSDVTPFAGFDPGSRPIGGPEIMLNPRDGFRMRAAKLFDDEREQAWGIDP
jgi:hypothetical protein